MVNAKKKEKEVVLVDENYDEQMLLLPNVSIKDIKKWLERVGVWKMIKVPKLLK